MPITKAKYFIDELTDWERTIAFYAGEIDLLTSRLHEVIRRNSIPNIAQQVEIQQSGLDRVSEKFSHLQVLLTEQKTSLKTDSILIDDSVINDKIETKQQDLRQGMLKAEKECIEARSNCQYFLSEIFKNNSE
ncbi:hypothetical protein GO495_28470 [Chitinophaga oryziterrae]|uniref:Uncharacterized protein n=1 Tax=Chitinophaga oryziterrae TaxID=1031224 RepID=A0A6N8JH34_9BACT|nr:hypothetical protein [Chitinophaga oryziterrae]MVT44563.1 hypothetical protein [Chitinophaga oryziterrae]